MTESNSLWQTRGLTAAYLEGVRAAIPGADLQLAVLGKIVQTWCPHPTRVLDLGCGDGILGRYLLDLCAPAKVLMIDFSDPMLDAARRQVGEDARVAVLKADFGAPAWLDAVTPHSPLDVVVSGFAIHHQPDARKRVLYAEIHDLLAPGGVFLNLEHVASASSAGERLFDEFFIDHLYELHSASDPGETRAQVADRYYDRPDKKENLLASVNAQCSWLREIGFGDVDCFFKVFELALFGGRKASA